MPKRSNPFQKLVARIYEYLAMPGASVNESAMVPEQKTGTLREVDVLLSHSAFGAEYKTAVECRGRARTDDIEWIDSVSFTTL